MSCMMYQCKWVISLSWGILCGCIFWNYIVTKTIKNKISNKKNTQIIKKIEWNSSYK